MVPNIFAVVCRHLRAAYPGLSNKRIRSRLVSKRLSLDILCKELMRAKVRFASTTQQAKCLQTQWVTSSLGLAKNNCMERESAERTGKSCVQPMAWCGRLFGSGSSGLGLSELGEECMIEFVSGNRPETKL